MAMSILTLMLTGSRPKAACPSSTLERAHVRHDDIQGDGGNVGMAKCLSKIISLMCLCRAKENMACGFKLYYLQIN